MMSPLANTGYELIREIDRIFGGDMLKEKPGTLKRVMEERLRVS